MDAPRFKLVDDLRRRRIDDFDTGETGQRAAIEALMPLAGQGDAGTCEQVGSGILESALGGKCDEEHQEFPLTAASKRSV